MFFKFSILFLGLFFLVGCEREKPFDPLNSPYEQEVSAAYPLLNDVPEKPEEPLWQVYEKETKPTYLKKDILPRKT